MYIFRVLLNALLICTLVLPAPLAAFAADITPDPAAAAGNRPGMDAASNGVPVVNIVAPTKSGLSHNMYLDFNVGKQGVIINNSNKPGISQLGGGMMGNPKFGGGAQATTILNEVTSNRPSSIQGFTEIFGGKADYILANPNGVSINGGGFINTSRAIMTTGVAGNNLSIEAQNLVNANGLILAKKEMALKGSKLENKGVRLYRDTHVEISKHGSYTASDGDGGEKTTSSHKEYDSSTLLSTVPSTIAAGGTLDLDFAKQINNDTIKRTDDYVSLAGAADGASGRVNLSVAGIGSLFTPAPEASKFVYTTNPGIPSLKALYGSEYFLSRVGWDLDKHHQKLLGDAFFETQLVRRQIAELNSRSVVASIDQPDEAVMLALMDNAVAEGSSLNLTVGIELTKAQLDALTKDIIWLVEEEHNGQTVLVPKVYLAKASRSTVSPNGVVMAAQDIRLKPRLLPVR
jgi:filamentous hemagglutinin family protein